MSRILVLSLLTIVLVAPVPVSAEADPGLWLHIRVDEGDDAKVVVNLPFKLIDKALPMIDAGGHIGDRSIHFHDHGFTYEEMRDLWVELRDGPDMEFVTIEERDETVRVWKENGHVYVRVRDRRDWKDERVDIRVPIRVVDALLGGDDEFDLQAAVAALAEQGEGELVSVQEDDESVRIWVDSNPESAG